jgi:hypothetical protein
MSTNGLRKHELKKALLSAYPSVMDLRKMLILLDVRLSEIAANGDLDDVAFSVVEHFYAEGRFADLERQAVDSNPRNEEILAYSAKYLISSTSQASYPTPLAFAAPGVRDALARFRENFEESRSHLTQLATYKEIHDLLHMLQVTYFNQIVSNLARFPDDDAACADLDEHAIGLESLIASLEATVRLHAFLRTVERAVADLKLVHAAVTQALAARSKPELQQAVKRLGSVLAVQPTLVNSKMLVAAQSLRFAELAKAVAAVRDHLQASAAQDVAEALASGAAELRDKAGYVDAMVNDHDRWQLLDIEVRRIATSVELRLDEFRDDWPRLRELTDELLEGSYEQWASDLRADMNAVEAALGGDDGRVIQRNFRRYRRRAAERFFRVDVNLKSLCDQLVVVGDTLKRTLETMRP